jgi:hypothetical protein
MNKNTNQNNYSIQKNYITNLEDACNTIGINRHEMIYIKTATIDANTINEQIDNMFNVGQEYVYNAMELYSEQSRIKKVISEITDANTNLYINSKYEDDAKLNKNPNAKEIIEDLYNSYRNGMKTAYNTIMQNASIAPLERTIKEFKTVYQK